MGFHLVLQDSGLPFRAHCAVCKRYLLTAAQPMQHARRTALPSRPQGPDGSGEPSYGHVALVAQQSIGSVCRLRSERETANRNLEAPSEIPSLCQIADRVSEPIIYNS